MPTVIGRKSKLIREAKTYTKQSPTRLLPRNLLFVCFLGGIPSQFLSEVFRGGQSSATSGIDVLFSRGLTDSS